MVSAQIQCDILANPLKRCENRINLRAHERNEVFILLTGIDQYINQKWQDRNFRGSSPDHRSIRVTEVNHCVNEEGIDTALYPI